MQTPNAVGLNGEECGETTIETTFNDKSKLPEMLDDLEVGLLWAQRDDLPVGAWNHASLANDFWRLYQNDAPGGFLKTPGGEIALQTNGVYLIPPGLALSSRNEGCLRQFFVHFDLRGIPPIVFLELLPGPTLLPPFLSLDERVQALGELVATESSRDFGVQCRLKGLVFEALGLYFSALPAHLQDQGRLRLSALGPVLPALAYIQETLGGRITSEAMAARCSMSVDYFTRRFRVAVGLPPSQYILNRRVALAAQRLLFTSESIEQIAVQTGFGDRFYFSRVFRRQTGRPPAAYRRGPRT